MTRGKIVLDGKSKENLEKKCRIQFFFLVFLSFWTARAYPKLRQQRKIRFRRRLALFEQKNWLRFWAKSGSVLRKSVTDLGEIGHRFWENQPPTSGKSAFGEIRLRFWGNPLLEKQARFLGQAGFVFGKKPSPSLGKQAPFFGTSRLLFWKKTVSMFGKAGCGLVENWLGFWIGLRQSSSFTVLNAKHVWVWI